MSHRRQWHIPFVVLTFGCLLAACDGARVKAVPDAPFTCDDQPWESAKVNPYRFIAHAGGAIDDRRYTNSREAMDRAYENGFRLLEADLLTTRDGVLVAVHDWDKWKAATGIASKEKPFHRQFKASAPFDRYHSMDLRDLNRWFADRPDAYLVTDKVTDFGKLLDGFSHTSRLIVEVFSVDDYRRAIALGVKYPMLSLEPALINDGDEKVYELLRTQPVKFVAIPQKRIKRQEDLLRALRKNRTCVYAFTSNDAGFLKRAFGDLLYGAYSDDWNVNRGECNAKVCDTY